MSAQLPLGFGGWRAPELADFWDEIDPLVLARLRALAVNPGASRILLTGAADTGKTHLLLAACESARASGYDAFYLPLSKFDAEALREPHVADLIAIDEADLAFADRELSEALFVLINRQQDRNRALLLAARNSPEQSQSVLPDLQSRLAQAERLRLSEHGDDARKAILMFRAHRAGIPLDPAAVEYLLRHSARDLRSLMQQLAALDRESLARGRRITVPLLREILAGWNPPARKL